MANLKSTVISGNGQFTASRLIGNADTASALQIVTLTSANIADYCTAGSGGTYSYFDLEPGKYFVSEEVLETVPTSSEQVKDGSDTGTGFVNMNRRDLVDSIIEVYSVNDQKIVMIENVTSLTTLDDLESPKQISIKHISCSKNTFTILGWCRLQISPNVLASNHVSKVTVNGAEFLATGTVGTVYIPYGTELSVTVTPDTNYKINSFTMFGQTVTGASGTVTVTKSAEYISTSDISIELDQVSLTVTKPTGASITINDTTVTQDSQVFTFTPGDSVHVVVTAEEGYNVTNITLNGETIAADYTFNISGSTTLVVAASIKMYNVKVFHPEHGTITVNGDTQNEYTFPHGSSLLIDVIPEEGWYVDRVDISQPGDIFHITTEGSDASTYTITVNGEPINPDGYAAGTECAVVVTPAEGYDVTAVTRSGYEFAANDSFFINYDNVINVTTSPKIFNIRVFQPETGGHIEVNGQTGTSFDYPYGTQIKIESVPDSGYEVARLDVSKDTDLYSVTIDANNANVALSPDKPGSEGKYYAGTTISYTVTPNSGYDITSVTVNENSEAAASGSWVINYDSTITVEASMQMVNIAVEQPANGRIEVNGEVGTSFDFPKGTSGITIQAFANEGYQVEGLYVTNLDEQAQSLDETSTQAIDNVIDTTAEVEDVDETPTIE